jgi:hypothetical protein
MIIIERKELIENIEKIRENLCSYFGSSCDCKYGANNKSEQTGCPELRMVLELLKNMNDEEFFKLLNVGVH